MTTCLIDVAQASHLLVAPPFWGASLIEPERSSSTKRSGGMPRESGRSSPPQLASGGVGSMGPPEPSAAGCGLPAAASTGDAAGAALQAAPRNTTSAVSFTP